MVENALVFDTVGSCHFNKIRAPLQVANDVWVGIMFQGDFLTKITLCSHRSRLLCEEDSGTNG
jgi:hypothetical protein